VLARAAADLKNAVDAAAALKSAAEKQLERCDYLQEARDAAVKGRTLAESKAQDQRVEIAKLKGQLAASRETAKYAAARAAFSESKKRERQGRSDARATTDAFLKIALAQAAALGGQPAAKRRKARGRGGAGRGRPSDQDLDGECLSDSPGSGSDSSFSRFAD